MAPDLPLTYPVGEHKLHDRLRDNAHVAYQAASTQRCGADLTSCQVCYRLLQTLNAGYGAHHLLLVVAGDGLMGSRSNEWLHPPTPEIPPLLICANVGSGGKGSQIAVVGAQGKGWRVIVCAGTPSDQGVLARRHDLLWPVHVHGHLRSPVDVSFP